MKKEIISEALNEISENHIAEAAEYRKKSIIKIAAAVSAAVLALVVGVIIIAGRGNEPKMLSQSDSPYGICINTDDISMAMADMDIQADFCLTAKGDSMINARINNGDIVFIREMPIVQNGDIAAVIIDNEATLKRWYYYKEDNKLMLVAENPKYPPLIYMNEELETIRCLGKAVYFMSAL